MTVTAIAKCPAQRPHVEMITILDGTARPQVFYKFVLADDTPSRHRKPRAQDTQMSSTKAHGTVLVQ